MRRSLRRLDPRAPRLPRRPDRRAALLWPGRAGELTLTLALTLALALAIVLPRSCSMGGTSRRAAAAISSCTQRGRRAPPREATRRATRPALRRARRQSRRAPRSRTSSCSRRSLPPPRPRAGPYAKRRRNRADRGRRGEGDPRFWHIVYLFIERNLGIQRTRVLRKVRGLVHIVPIARCAFFIYLLQGLVLLYVIGRLTSPRTQDGTLGGLHTAAESFPATAGCSVLCDAMVHVARACTLFCR